MIDEQKIVEFFEDHPHAVLLASRDMYAEAAATGWPTRRSDLLADGKLYAVDLKAMCNVRMSPPEIKPRGIWEQLWNLATRSL